MVKPLTEINGNWSPHPTFDDPALVDGSSSCFPEKLWHIINDPKYQEAIHWSDDGECVVIENSPKFTAMLLLDEENKIFKTKNINSFIRQLNLYGFKKVQNRDKLGKETDEERLFGKSEFKNSLFKRGRYDLIAHMKRKLNSRQDTRSETRSKRSSKSRQHNSPFMYPFNYGSYFPPHGLPPYSWNSPPLASPVLSPPENNMDSNNFSSPISGPGGMLPGYPPHTMPLWRPGFNGDPRLTAGFQNGKYPPNPSPTSPPTGMSPLELLCSVSSIMGGTYGIPPIPYPYGLGSFPMNTPDQKGTTKMLPGFANTFGYSPFGTITPGQSSDESFTGDEATSVSSSFDNQEEISDKSATHNAEAISEMAVQESTQSSESVNAHASPMTFPSTQKSDEETPCAKSPNAVTTRDKQIQENSEKTETEQATEVLENFGHSAISQEHKTYTQLTNAMLQGWQGVDENTKASPCITTSSCTESTPSFSGNVAANINVSPIEHLHRVTDVIQVSTNLEHNQSPTSTIDSPSTSYPVMNQENVTSTYSYYIPLSSSQTLPDQQLSWDNFIASALLQGMQNSATSNFYPPSNATASRSKHVSFATTPDMQSPPCNNHLKPREDTPHPFPISKNQAVINLLESGAPPSFLLSFDESSKEDTNCSADTSTKSNLPDVVGHANPHSNGSVSAEENASYSVNAPPVMVNNPAVCAQTWIERKEIDNHHQHTSSTTVNNSEMANQLSAHPEGSTKDVTTDKVTSDPDMASQANAHSYTNTGDKENVHFQNVSLPIGPVVASQLIAHHEMVSQASVKPCTDETKESINYHDDTSVTAAKIPEVIGQTISHPCAHFEDKEMGAFDDDTTAHPCLVAEGTQQTNTLSETSTAVEEIPLVSQCSDNQQSSAHDTETTDYHSNVSTNGSDVCVIEPKVHGLTSAADKENICYNGETSAAVYKMQSFVHPRVSSLMSPETEHVCFKRPLQPLSGNSMVIKKPRVEPEVLKPTVRENRASNDKENKVFLQL